MTRSPTPQGQIAVSPGRPSGGGARRSSALSGRRRECGAHGGPADRAFDGDQQHPRFVAIAWMLSAERMHSSSVASLRPVRPSTAQQYAGAIARGANAVGRWRRIRDARRRPLSSNRRRGPARARDRHHFESQRRRAGLRSAFRAVAAAPSTAINTRERSPAERIVSALRKKGRRSSSLPR